MVAVIVHLQFLKEEGAVQSQRFPYAMHHVAENSAAPTAPGSAGRAESAAAVRCRRMCRPSAPASRRPRTRNRSWGSNVSRV